MGRWTDQDSDAERLPAGYERIGYDADTETYTFRAPNGTLYESESGSRYGPLYPVGQPRPRRTSSEIDAHNASLKQGNRESVKLILPFALLVLVFLLLVIKFLGSGSSGGDTAGEKVQCREGFQGVEVKTGDTCWGIGDKLGLSVEELLGFEGNEEVDCDVLKVGQRLCVPV